MEDWLKCQIIKHIYFRIIILLYVLKWWRHHMAKFDASLDK